jgi:hypothetical protein
MNFSGFAAFVSNSLMYLKSVLFRKKIGLFKKIITKRKNPQLLKTEDLNILIVS